MALILCIESGTNTCSVAIGNSSGLVDIMESHAESNNHAKNLTLFIDTLLKKQNLKPTDIDAVAVGKGPGSYTGLRIGVSAAKGFCYGAGIPLIAIGSLHSMAFGIKHWYEGAEMEDKPQILCPMIDARRLEVYTQLFDTELQNLSEVEAKILDENSYNNILADSKILFFGNGSNKAQDLINHPHALYVNNFKPSAQFMLTIAHEMFTQKQFEDVAYFEPFYLKDFVATIAKNKVLGNR